MDGYKLVLAVIGGALLGAAWLPHLIRRRPLTLPIIYILAGMGLYALPLPLPPPDPLRFPGIAEHLTELAVLVPIPTQGGRMRMMSRW